MQKRASRDVAAVLLARRTFARLHKDSESRRAKFTSSITSRDAPDAIEKRAFVQKLAEAWVFLTGQRPGKGRTVEKNPFLQFVEAAWQDWKGEEVEAPSFVAPLGNALASLSDYRVRLLAADGPDWLHVSNPYRQFLDAQSGP
jgi:hypothetical protein